MFTSGLFLRKITNAPHRESRGSMILVRFHDDYFYCRDSLVHFSRFKWWLWRPTCSLTREAEKQRFTLVASAVCSLLGQCSWSGVKGSTAAGIYAYRLVAELRCNFSYTASVFFFGCASNGKVKLRLQFWPRNRTPARVNANVHLFSGLTRVSCSSACNAAECAQSKSAINNIWVSLWVSRPTLYLSTIVQTACRYLFSC